MESMSRAAGGRRGSCGGESGRSCRSWPGRDGDDSGEGVRGVKGVSGSGEPEELGVDDSADVWRGIARSGVDAADRMSVGSIDGSL